MFDFAAGDRSQIDLLGQGSQPRRDDEPGVPVPPGFTITTKACRHYLTRGEESQSLRVQVTWRYAGWRTSTGGVSATCRIRFPGVGGDGMSVRSNDHGCGLRRTGRSDSPRRPGLSAYLRVMSGARADPRSRAAATRPPASHARSAARPAVAGFRRSAVAAPPGSARPRRPATGTTCRARLRWP